MRLKNSCVAVFAVFTLFIAGCSNNLVGRVAGDGKGESTVTFSVTDIPANYAEMIRQAQNPATRTIYPHTAPHDAFKLNDSGLKFKLVGKSNSGDSITRDITLTASTDTTASFTEPLGPYVWHLTLTAYKGNPSDNKKVLEGYCTVDLTNGNGNATFKMSTKGLTTPGTVKVKGKVKDPDGLCTKYEIGVYNAYSGKLVEKYQKLDGSGEDTTNAKFETNVTHIGTPGSYPSFDFSYGAPTVTLNAGVYTYTMIFYKDTKVIGSWSDTLVVNPGHDLDEDVGEIDPLNKKPEPPSNLRAYFVKNSDDTEGRYFYTKLTWDTGRYETNYELQITPYSGTGTSLTAGSPIIYGFQSTYSTPSAPPPPPPVKEFVTSDIYHEGNLIYGSTECTLKLELGKVYDVKIRAHNYLGESDWVQRVVTTSTTPPDNCTLFDGTNGSHISRYRITYNLNGGALILKDKPVDAPIHGTYSEYKFYTGTAVNLMSIANTPIPSPPATAAANFLTRGTAAFTGWGKLSGTPPSIITTYDRYENVIVTASYGNSFTGSLDLETLAEIDKKNIIIEYGDHNLAPLTKVHPATPPDMNYTVDIPKKTGASLESTWIKVSFAPTAIPASEEYSNMQCTLYLGNGLYINKLNLISAADGKSCTFSTQDYIPQKITLQVKATNKAHQTVGKTFLINLY